MEEAQDMRERLEAYLIKAKFPQREGLSVVEMERMPVGISYETYLFTVTWKEAQGAVSESLVIRMEPECGCVPPYDIRPQYEVLKRVYGTGIPVPKVHWLEMDSKVLGHPFFVMERIEGGDVLYNTYWTQPELREQLTRDYVSILARLHGLDWQALGLSILGVPENDRQYAEKEIARWEAMVEDNQYSPQPVVAELITWLKRNIPRAERTTLCHGDYHSRNFLTRDGRIVAVLDWEIVG
ncbi:MAG: phosphotransferase family protein, partial [Candidatus Krumholzibacteria bacterium]|nr:phosphotransferase family protein [Candidatus Krumholzibacteria bacterium]